MNLRLLLWRLFGFVIGKYSMFTAPSSHHDDVCIDFSWESKGNPPKATSPKDPFHPRHGTQLFFSPNSNTNSCHKCLDVPYCYLSLPSFLIISINQTALKPAVQLPERSFRESSGNFRNSVINESLLWPTPTKKKGRVLPPGPSHSLEMRFPNDTSWQRVQRWPCVPCRVDSWTAPIIDKRKTFGAFSIHHNNHYLVAIDF